MTDLKRKPTIDCHLFAGRNHRRHEYIRGDTPTICRGCHDLDGPYMAIPGELSTKRPRGNRAHQQR